MKKEQFLKWMSLIMVIGADPEFEPYYSMEEEDDQCLEITGPVLTVNPTSTMEKDATVKSHATAADGMMSAPSKAKRRKTMEHKNVKVVEQPRENRICRRCKKPFSISKNEQEWLKERNLELFTHCKECRAIRKEEKASATNTNPLTGKAAIKAAVDDINKAGRVILAQSGVQRSQKFEGYLAGKGTEG